MSERGETAGTDSVALAKLQGGSKWHCPDVECRYVTAADSDLNGATRTVRWDPTDRSLSVVDADETLSLAHVCNYCQQQQGWWAVSW